MAVSEIGMNKLSFMFAKHTCFFEIKYEIKITVPLNVAKQLSALAAKMILKTHFDVKITKRF